MMNERTEESIIQEPLHKTRTPSGGLLLFAQVKNLIRERENKNTAQEKELN